MLRNTSDLSQQGPFPLEYSYYYLQVLLFVITHSDSKNPGYFTHHLEDFGFFHSVLHDVDFLFIQVPVQQLNGDSAGYCTTESPHKMWHWYVYVLFNMKLCTFDHTWKYSIFKEMQAAFLIWPFP